MSVISVPAAPRGTLAQQVQQQYTYLFQLAQALNLSLQQLEGQSSGEGSVVTGKGSDGKALPTATDLDTQAASLKSLIIKTADTVQANIDTLSQTLTGSYVAQSDFGSYVQEISQQIEADPTKLEQYFKFASEMQTDIDQVGVDFSKYKTETQGFIRQGIVRYDGTTPIIGIAIGQDIQTTATGVETETGTYDQIDTSSNMSVWTAEKLSFYIGGQEAAYFSNGKLTVSQIATDRITGAGSWDVRFTNGVKYKWIGG